MDSVVRDHACEEAGELIALADERLAEGPARPGA
jgi:hypothetical protein